MKLWNHLLTKLAMNDFNFYSYFLYLLWPYSRQCLFFLFSDVSICSRVVCVDISCWFKQCNEKENHFSCFNATIISNFFFIFQENETCSFVTVVYCKLHGGYFFLFKRIWRFLIMQYFHVCFMSYTTR